MANLQSAAEQFIRNHGNAVELARLQYLLDGSRPSETVIAQLHAQQNADGSWSPFWAPHAGSIDATCYRLTQSEQLGLSRDEPAIRRALQFLESSQTQEGYFEEAATLADSAPPWAAPGKLDARLYLSANAAFWLAFYQGNTTSVERTTSYVTSFLEEDGKLPSFLHTHWLMSGVLLHLGQTDRADRTLQYLRNRLHEMDASNLAWCMNALNVMGLPNRSDFVEQALSRLSETQHEDGHWSGETGDSQDVHTTLECLRLFKRR